MIRRTPIDMISGLIVLFIGLAIMAWSYGKFMVAITTFTLFSAFWICIAVVIGLIGLYVVVVGLGALTY